MTISAIVIARNEEKRIGTCLESMQFADEIIVVDNSSTDTTVKIAEKYRANVVSHPGQDFSELRNIGKKYAKGIWIVYIDADETVPRELADEILSIARSDTDRPHSCYYIKRKNYYLGTAWKKTDRMQRLFRKEKLLRWEGRLHETAIVSGSVGECENALIHDTHRTLEEMVAKTNEWSNIESELRFRAHHPAIVWWRPLRVMGTGFFRSFIGEGGYQMKTVGWIEAIFQAYSMFITYAKLWELQNNERLPTGRQA